MSTALNPMRRRVPRRSTTLSLYVPTLLLTRPFVDVQAHEKANKELAKAQSALEKAQHGKLTGF